MNRKSVVLMFLMLLTASVVLRSQTTGNAVANTILSGYSAKMFTSDPVSDQDLDLILKCGMKAPSARNSQEWKFTVIKDAKLMAEAIPNINPGNILILISGQESQQEGAMADYDCGLATENMYVAAQGLGLGVHIYAGPVRSFDSAKKKLLGVPDGYRAIAILRIGHVDKNVDAVSAASARKKPEEVVIYK